MLKCVFISSFEVVKFQLNDAQKYEKGSCIDKRRLIESHSRGEVYIALADCLRINRNTAYTIVRRGRYENLPKGGSCNRKIEEVILGAIGILEGNPLITLHQVKFEICVESALTPKTPFYPTSLIKSIRRGNTLEGKVQQYSNFG